MVGRLVEPKVSSCTCCKYPNNNLCILNTIAFRLKQAGAQHGLGQKEIAQQLRISGTPCPLEDFLVTLMIIYNSCNQQETQ